MTLSLMLPRQHRAPRLLLIAILHLGLLYVLLRAQEQPREEPRAPQGPHITWLRTTPPAPAKAPATPAVKPTMTPTIKPAVRLVAKPAPDPALTPLVQPPAPLAVAAAPVEETAAPAPSRAADILAQAKRDVGKIDRDLRREFPRQGGIKLEDTAYKRMQQGFADAYAAVPPKWYEASRIEELGSDMTKGVRVYKITSALGSMCVTLRAGKNGETTIGICPK